MTDTTVSAPASGSRLGAGAAMPRAGSRGSGSVRNTSSVA